MTTEGTAPAADSAAPADKAVTEAAEDLLGTTTDAGAADKGADGKDGKEAAAPEDDSDDLLEGKVKKDEDKKEGEGDAASETDYADIKIPEGYEADKELADISFPVFKEAGLKKEQAQALVENLGPKILTHIGEKYAKQWKETQSGWAKEFKNDAEYGGKNLDASLANVARARDYLGPDFTAAIKLVGGNNHPAILKALAKVGQALGEDTPAFGKPSAKESNQLERLYPNDQPKSKE